MVAGCRDVLVGIKCDVLGSSVMSIASELEEAVVVLVTSFLQFLFAVSPRLSIPAGILSNAPFPPIELDGAADEALAIFGLGTGKGFGGGGGVGLGDGGFLGGN